MDYSDYPALYRSADTAAVAAQKAYLRQTAAQYAFLVSAGITTVFFDDKPFLFVVYAALVGGASILLVHLSFRSREHAWYACRALAESTKTTVWRYIMRADPYGNVISPRDLDVKFTSFLQNQLAAHNRIAAYLADEPQKGPQITPAMAQLRSLSIAERKCHYRVHRVQEQRAWYSRKAKAHRCQFHAWTAATLVTQGTAICLALLRIEYHDVWLLWPITPLLLLSSSFLGWVQVKKFNELASSYGLAEAEISLVETSMDHVRTEDELSRFVNDAELAFSREHTLWVARRSE